MPSDQHDDPLMNASLDFIHSTMESEHASLKDFKPLEIDANDKLDDDEIFYEKPAYGKRSMKKLIIDLVIWIILTIYAILLMLRGQGKDGYVLAIIVYIFISLRLLARHVSMSILVYRHIGNAFSFIYDGSVGKISPALRIYGLFGVTFSALLLTALLANIDPEVSSISERIQSLFGVVVILSVMTLTSRDRSRIPWHTVAVGMFMQYLIAMFVLKTTVGIQVFQFLSRLITNFLETSSVGLEFLIGSYAHTSFAVNVLPAIIFFCAFISVVYYFGGMQYIVVKMAWFMMRLMDTSGSESVVAAASPFVGQGESALLVKPFVEYMTKSELHSTMTSGFSTIAGSVLLAYIGFLDDASSLLCSCVMSIPASLLLSKMRYPEKEQSITKGEVKIPPAEEKEANFLHAAGNGSGTGIHLVLLICAALLAIVTLFTVCDQFVGWAFGMIEVYDFVNGPNADGSMKPISIQLCLSYLFYPFAWLIGMPSADARKAGEVMAVKMVVNEFLAYSQLADLRSQHLIQPRTVKLLTYALCGFANVASIGIQLGCLGVMAPSRKHDLSELAMSAMLTGTNLKFMTVNEIKSLPLFDIDELFHSSKEFFFSMYHQDKSFHTKLHVEDGIKCADQIPLDFAMTENELKVVYDGQITVISPIEKLKVDFKVSAIAISPDGSWIAIGGENGKLGIYNSDIVLQVNCQGHKSDITLIKFFPSNQVLLSGSLDMSLRVWGMDGSNPVTLVGHTRLITDAAIVDRGRLILSSSLDGTVKLWHIASSSTIFTFKPEENCGITAIKLLECDWLDSSDQPSKEDPEGDLTRNKLLLIGTTTGNIYGYNLFSRNLLFNSFVPDHVRIQSLDASTEYKKIWASLENGVFSVFSITENLQVSVESSYCRSKAPLFISHLPCKNTPGLWLSSIDGSCALWSFENGQILKELAVSSTQSSCVYGFESGKFVCSGSSGIVYVMKGQ